MSEQRIYPCGCILCICPDEWERCGGCGGRSCGQPGTPDEHVIGGKPRSMKELLDDEARLRRELAEAEESIRRLAWKECGDCNGSGWSGRASAGRKVSCESCGGHEDSLGDGWIPNHDNIAETMNLPAVRRAIESGGG